MVISVDKMFGGSLITKVSFTGTKSCKNHYYLHSRDGDSDHANELHLVLAPFAQQGVPFYYKMFVSFFSSPLDFLYHFRWVMGNCEVIKG